MASRDDVYVHFGRAAELAQMLEREIGTALLALDGLQTKSYLKPDADAYRRLTQATEAQTLGTSLKQMGKYFNLKNDAGAVFSRALETRNRLTLAGSFIESARLERKSRGDRGPYWLVTWAYSREVKGGQVFVSVFQSRTCELTYGD